MVDIQQSKIEKEIRVGGEYESPPLEAEEVVGQEVVEATETPKPQTSIKEIQDRLSKSDEGVVSPAESQPVPSPEVGDLSALDEGAKLEIQRDELMKILHGDSDIIANAAQQQEKVLGKGLDS